MIFLLKAQTYLNVFYNTKANLRFAHSGGAEKENKEQYTVWLGGLCKRKHVFFPCVRVMGLQAWKYVDSYRTFATWQVPLKSVFPKNYGGELCSPPCI